MALTSFQTLTDTPTLDQQIDELGQLHLEMQRLRNRASHLLGAIAAYNGPIGPAYGAIVETFAEDAAKIVDGRKEAEFAAAPFDGKNVRAQSRLCHAIADFRAVGEALIGDTIAAQTGAAAQLGATVSTIIDTTQYSLQNPFTKDPEVLDTLSAPLLRRVEKYQAGIQSKKGLLGRFRSLVSDGQAENQRLADEVQVLRGAQGPGTPPVPAAPRRTRRTRRT
jgi:hypothetical protein